MSKERGNPLSLLIDNYIGSVLFLGYYSFIGFQRHAASLGRRGGNCPYFFIATPAGSIAIVFLFGSITRR